MSTRLADDLLDCEPMSGERVRKAITRSGDLNVEVEGFPYHSAYDPKREAAKFYGAYPIEKSDVILQFGWGLGYCADILISRMKPSARVIVFEPDEELFRLFKTHVDQSRIANDPRFQFVVGSSVRHFFDAWTLQGCRETDEFLWIIWPGAEQLHRSLATLLQESFKMRLRDHAANLLTHFQNGGMYFENALANFEYQTDPDAGRLFGRLRGIPLVIVSAGPSLDRNIRELRGVEDRCFILAVDTALRPLLAAGVQPHAVLIADPTELNARHVVGALPESVYLIAEQAIHNSALRAASRRFLFGLGLFPDFLCGKFGLSKSSLQIWGSVATGALDLACRMGASPIIFAGQDLAFSWDRDYARHTMFDGRPFDIDREGTHREVDIWGRDVRTTENLIAYRDFFVRKIRQTSGVRFINATEGGILTDAVEILSLRDALAQSCSRPHDIAGILRTAHSVAGGKETEVRAALDHLCRVLDGQSSECGCLNGFLDLTAKEAVLKDDREALNGKIAWGRTICEQFSAALGVSV